MTNDKGTEIGIKSGADIASKDLGNVLAYRTAEIVHAFFQCVDDILKKEPSYREIDFDFRVIEKNPELIRKNIHAMTLMLLDPLTRAHATEVLKKREKLFMDDNKALLPSAFDWLETYLQNLPELKQSTGTKPLAVIRNFEGKKYLSLDIGKVLNESHYSRIFFGDTLEPVWMEVDPKTGDIVDGTVCTFGN